MGMPKELEKILEKIAGIGSDEEEDLEPLVLIKDHPELKTLVDAAEIRHQEFKDQAAALKKESREVKKVFWKEVEDYLIAKDFIIEDDRKLQKTYDKGIIFMAKKP